AAGGEVVLERRPGPERVAHIRDPAGNLVGVYEQPALAERERATAAIPEHLHTITPRLALSDAAAAIDFYKAAFGAEEIGERHHMPDGTLVHAVLALGVSVVMVTEADGEGTSSLLRMHCDDVDA